MLHPSPSKNVRDLRIAVIIEEERVSETSCFSHVVAASLG